MRRSNRASPATMATPDVAQRDGGRWSSGWLGNVGDWHGTNELARLMVSCPGIRSLHPDSAPHTGRGTKSTSIFRLDVLLRESFGLSHRVLFERVTGRFEDGSIPPVVFPPFAADRSHFL